MTSIQSHGCPRRERTSKSQLGSSSPLESSYDKTQSISLLNLLLLSIRKKMCKKSSGQSLKPKLPPLTAPVRSHWRLDHLTSIMVSPTWNAIISVSSVRITLPLPEPKVPTAFFLQHLSCMTASTSVGSSTSGNTRLKAQFPSPERSLRPFFVKA